MVFTNTFNFFFLSVKVWPFDTVVKCRHGFFNCSGRCLAKVLGPHLRLEKITVKSSFPGKEKVEKIISSQT